MANEQKVRERSSLWTASAVTAPAIGFGIGMRGHWSDLSSAFRRPLMDYGNAVKRVQQFPAYATPEATAEIKPLEYFGSLITGAGNKEPMRRDIAQAAYESIMSGSRPVSHSRAYKIFNQIMAESASPLDAYATAGRYIQQYGGSAGLFDERIAEMTRGFTYNREIGTTVISQPIIIAKNRLVDPRELMPEEMHKYKDIREQLSKILGEDKLGKSSIVRAKGVPMMRTKIRGLSSTIDLPLVETSVLPLGKNFEQEYVLRQAYEITKEGKISTSGFTEHYLNTLSANVAKNKARSTVAAKQAVIESNQQLIRSLNDDAAAKRLAVWMEPDEFLPSGGLARKRLAAEQVVFSGKRMTPALLEKAVGQGLFPFGSQSAIGSGTLFKKDIRRSLYGAMGEFFPAQKSPLQFIRGDWGLSRESKLAAASEQFAFKGTLGEYYHRLERKFVGGEYNALMGIETQLGDWGDAAAGRAISYTGRGAYVTPQLLTFYAKPGAGGFESPVLRDMMAEEMGVVSSQMTDTMQFERMVSQKIRVVPGMEVNEALGAAIERNRTRMITGEPITLESSIPVERGTFIGMGASGKRVMGGAQRGIQQEIIGFQPMPGDILNVQMRERYSLGGGEPAKFMGTTTKHMVKARSQETIEDILTKVGVGTEFGGNKVSMIMSGARAQKIPYSLFSQQMHAMSTFAAGGLDTFAADQAASWKLLAPRVRSFLSDQVKFLGIEEMLNKQEQISMGELRYSAQKRIVEGARSLGLLQAGKMEHIFGLMDEKDLGRLVTEGALSKEEARIISSSRGVIGMESMFLADLAREGGAGGLGKLDPSGLRVLYQKGYPGDAGLGQDLAADIARRFERPTGLQAAERMQMSLTGMGRTVQDFLSGGPAEDITKVSNFAPEQGQWLNLGRKVDELGGASRIYMPGTGEMAAMAPVRGSSGEVIGSNLSRGYQRLARAARSGEVADIEAAAGLLRQTAFQEYARTNVASGSASIGKVTGSRYLTAERMSAEVAEAMGGSIGISEATGRSMYQDLINRSTGIEREQLIEQQNRFLAGEVAGGTVWRHPTAGAESVQATTLRMMSGAIDDMAYIPPKMGMFNMPGFTQGQEMVDISQATGMKLDYDIDRINLSVVANRDLENRTRRAVVGDVSESYNEYLAKHYMLDRMLRKQDNDVLRGLPAIQEEARAAGYGKMATGQTNIALQQLKLAVASQRPEQYNELAAMFWHLEERASINTKQGMIGGADLYKRISSSVTDANEEQFRGVLEDVFGSQPRKMAATLEGKEYSFDYDPARLSRESIGSLRNAQEDVRLSQELASVAKSGRPLSSERMAEHITFARGGLSLDPGQRMVRAMELGEEQLFTAISRKTRGVTTKLRGIAGVLSRAKTPLAMGAVAGAAIMMAAPSVSGAMKHNPNIQGPAGGKNVDMLNSLPPTGPGIAPPKSQIMRSQRAYNLPSTRMTGTYTSGDLDVNYSDAMRHIATMRNSETQARMYVSDNRSAMDPHMLANKIHERM